MKMIQSCHRLSQCYIRSSRLTVDTISKSVCVPSRHASTTPNGATKAVDKNDNVEPGYVFTQGLGVYGALGTGSLTKRHEAFTEISFTRDYPAVKIASGWGHSMMIDAHGLPFVWGKSYAFKHLLKQYKIGLAAYYVASFLGSSDKGVNRHGKLDNVLKAPFLLEVGDSVVDIKCSAGFSTILTKEGKLFFFGDNHTFQSGMVKPSKRDIIFYPEVIPMRPVMNVDIGYSHLMTVDNTGDIYGWGRNPYGQVGLEADLVVESPTCVRLPRKLPATMVSCAFAHTTALADSGEVFIWGRHMSEVQRENRVKKGEYVYDNQTKPRKLIIPNDVRMRNIVSSHYSTAFIGKNGELFALGMDESRQIMVNRPLPVVAVDHNDTEKIQALLVHHKEKDQAPMQIEGFVTFALSQILKDVNPHAAIRDVDIKKEYDAVISDISTKRSQVILGPNDLVMKGHDRIVVIRRSLSNGDRIEGAVEEIVIDDGIAYLVPRQLEFNLPDDGSKYRLNGFAQGWQHNVAILTKM